MRTFVSALMMAGLIALGAPVAAQQTTGNITGRIVDDQGAAVPGVTVTARNAQTGFTRTDTSDAEGIYRLNAMPVGTYDITAELQGFSRIESKGIVLNVGQTHDINLTLKVASLQETVTVSGETPIIEIDLILGWRRRGHRADREPAAQRPAVREPRRDDSRRRPRIPLRSDEELAVLAADQRRQRPQRQLSDRRWRQQRRHGRRPCSSSSRSRRFRSSTS